MAAKQTAIVTGASQGIGAAIVRAFLERGYNVVATSRKVTDADFARSPSLTFVEILPYPLQRYLVRNLSILAEKAAKAELIPAWAGQSANLTRHKDATELLQTLVADVSMMIHSRFGGKNESEGERR